ncbi:iron complex transport system substrate-binding protein [Halovenus aranensis]|jgi:iron complex transport system substrate-binding protein|uniref:Iron complex transport system substrate-binding protein n=1 Tax=Halovenus aranensis TaxID=890420 RepID=A0A1G8U7G3_9EURY|nr:PGF-CTERM-anchored ABC transporter substrate-binding protein [Halovenus aranensis]SDJ49659.1 iron complex transport system substrate-binding protein [Halovenus aranensis]
MHRTDVFVLVAVVAGLVLAGGVVAADSGPETSTTTQLSCEFPQEVEDGGGETVTVEQEPEDVVVLAPNNAQHMWEIGAKDKVVGMPVNQFTSYLNGSEERTNVVDERGFPVTEEVVNLEPDLVIAADIISEDTVTQLRNAGLTVYQSPLLTGVEDMLSEVERVGQLVGECEGASETVEETRQRMSEIANAVADEEAPTVYYDLGFPFTVGEGTLENELITMAGGDNIASEAGESYFQISEEVVATNDPEWLVLRQGAPIPDVTAIQESTAVQEDQIIRVNPNYISQHGPRNVIPLRQMAEAFHPDAMAELDATPTPTPTATPTASPTATATEATTPEPTATETPMESATATMTPTESGDADGDGAGFAVVSAVMALLTVSLFARYRR